MVSPEKQNMLELPTWPTLQLYLQRKKGKPKAVCTKLLRHRCKKNTMNNNDDEVKVWCPQWCPVCDRGTVKKKFGCLLNRACAHLILPSSLTHDCQWTVAHYTHGRTFSGFAHTLPSPPLWLELRDLNAQVTCQNCHFCPDKNAQDVRVLTFGPSMTTPTPLALPTKRFCRHEYFYLPFFAP